MNTRAMWMLAGAYVAGLGLGCAIGRALVPRKVPAPVSLVNPSRPGNPPLAGMSADRKEAASPGSTPPPAPATGTLLLAMPPGGTNYDRLEVVRLGSKQGPSRSGTDFLACVVPLQFAGAKRITKLLPGEYRLILKSRSPERVRDHILAPALSIRQAAPAASWISPPR